MEYDLWSYWWLWLGMGMLMGYFGPKWLYSDAK